MANIVIKRSFNANAPITVEALSGFLFTQENQAHVFEIDGISSGSATGYFIAPDGTTKTCSGTVSGGKATVTLSQDCYNDPGRFKFAIMNSTGGVTTCIYAAVGNVYRTKDGEIYDSGEVVPSLNELLGYIANCQQAADRADNAADVILGGEVTITQSSSNITNGYWNGIVGQTMTFTEQADDSSGNGYRTVRNPIDISEFTPGTTISLKSTVTGAHGVRITDKNMQILAYYSGDNGNAPIDVTMTVPEGAKYLTQVIRHYSAYPERTAVSNFSVTGTTGGIIPRIEAIEEQIGSADGSADSNIVLSENLTSSNVNAGMLRINNTVAAHDSYSYTNYIYVEPYEKITVKNLHISGSAGMAFVDGDISNPILVQGYKSSDFSGYTTGSDVTIDVPEGACYFRTSQVTAQVPSLKIIGNMSTAEAITRLYNKVGMIGESVNTVDNSIAGTPLSMFTDIVCCGDSLTYSAVFTDATHHRQAFVPWPTQIERMYGIPTDIKADSGKNPKTWFADYGDTIAQSSEGNRLYITYFGHNASAQYPYTDTFETDCPADADPSTWADTLTGWWGRIINDIYTAGCKALIIRVSDSNGYRAVQDAIIEDIAARWNVPVIDNPYLPETIYHSATDSYANEAHYNDLGYMAFCRQLMTNINKMSLTDLGHLLPV